MQPACRHAAALCAERPAGAATQRNVTAPHRQNHAALWQCTIDRLAAAPRADSQQAPRYRCYSASLSDTLLRCSALLRERPLSGTSVLAGRADAGHSRRWASARRTALLRYLARQQAVASLQRLRLLGHGQCALACSRSALAAVPARQRHGCAAAQLLRRGCRPRRCCFRSLPAPSAPQLTRPSRC